MQRRHNPHSVGDVTVADRCGPGLDAASAPGCRTLPLYASIIRRPAHRCIPCGPSNSPFTHFFQVISLRFRPASLGQRARLGSIRSRGLAFPPFSATSARAARVRSHDMCFQNFALCSLSYPWCANRRCLVLLPQIDDDVALRRTLRLACRALLVDPPLLALDAEPLVYPPRLSRIFFMVNHVPLPVPVLLRSTSPQPTSILALRPPASVDPPPAAPALHYVDNATLPPSGRSCILIPILLCSLLSPRSPTSLFLVHCDLDQLMLYSLFGTVGFFRPAVDWLLLALQSQFLCAAFARVSRLHGRAADQLLLHRLVVHRASSSLHQVYSLRLRRQLKHSLYDHSLPHRFVMALLSTDFDCVTPSLLPLSTRNLPYSPS
ncbi:hypothetical protein C8R45DRAFT_1173726 [Mycena sanguinolenta]|nr:hypothetical protein C8R45DRAFT_1173726 [Mycena sanguinolenta]